MPFVPDLRFVIEQVLTVMMFLSGIVFSLEAVPEPMRAWFALNPIATLVDAGRGILMHAQWPDWLALGRVTLISLALFALGTWLVARWTSRYVKLPT
jgi:lipopolysaccharide transport system permease protein